MKKHSPNSFQRDFEMKQRNIVFPDTVRNYAGMWRELMTLKKPLTVVQIVGLLLICLSLLSAMGSLALSQFHRTPGTGLARIVSGFGGYVILLGLNAAAFLLLRWRIRRALIQAQNTKRKHSPSK